MSQDLLKKIRQLIILNSTVALISLGVVVLLLVIASIPLVVWLAPPSAAVVLTALVLLLAVIGLAVYRVVKLPE